MTISYKWLSEYLPIAIEPDRLSRILTSIGLEVEALEKYEEVKGGLIGLVIGEVISAEKHPNADKLSLTKVNIGAAELLQIVCGAPNVAAGQKVIVAPVGTTIFPTNGDPLTMKVAKIRSVESQGMICAEDEIGLGSSHAGIIVLPSDLKPGTPASEYYKPYEDFIYEIGLTPNRMDAMSHWGVARDVCAYLSYHDKKDYRARIPNSNEFKIDNNDHTVDVKVENPKACPRYSGLTISDIAVGPSPAWLQQRLRSIGLRPISNIVDITNFIQYETGQPLHAFDYDKLNGKKIIVKNLPEGTAFISLDEKKRKLSEEDLMICDEKDGICIAGVFGGLESGVSDITKNIFLESAYFDPVSIRKSSFRHGLRTDAAMRFEKGTDISATVNVLRRAAILIKEICGGKISSQIIDIYPDPVEKRQVAIKYHYLKKLSGKNYHPDAVKNILSSLGFEVLKEGIDELRVAVPYHKPDISLPADLVEEVLRIDGLDNVEIPESITITPSIEENYPAQTLKEKISNYLVGLGFNEIITNSITQSSYFSEEELSSMVRMLNSLSAQLDVMRPSLFETSLEIIAHNLNRKVNDLKIFEFGKAYSTSGPGNYIENEQLCLVVTGSEMEGSWNHKQQASDFYYLKGVVAAVFQSLGLKPDSIEVMPVPKFESHVVLKINGNIVAGFGQVNKKVLAKFDIKQPVYYAGINWQQVSVMAALGSPSVKPIPRYPAVERDLAMIVSAELPYQQVESVVNGIRIEKLKAVKLFDVFKSEKLGAGKKSIAINFTFQDEEKTLTDKEIDAWMNKIIHSFENELKAEIRKQAQPN